MLGLPQYDVPVCNWERLEKAMQGLQKRIEKAGGQPLRLAVIGRTMKPYGDMEMQYLTVIVDGTLPPVGDWELVGRITYDGDTDKALVFLPTVDRAIPEKFRDHGRECDHCRMKRKRNHLLILKHRENGELMQVGTSCLFDFTQDQTAAQVVAQMGVIIDLQAALAGASAIDDVNQAIKFSCITLERYLVAVCDVLAGKDYVSRSCSDWHTPATADLAWEVCLKGVRPERLFVAEELAGKVFAWAVAEFTNPAPGNDYAYNMHTIIETGAVSMRTAGYAASLVPGYWRAMKAAATVQAGASDHIGTVGERIQLTVTVQASIELQPTSFGRVFLNRFVDKAGNVLVWFTSSQYDVGTVWAGRATIREHSIYGGVKQTVLTRCSFKEVLDASSQTDPVLMAA